MIPLKDTIPSRTFPIITIFLIIINVLIFFFEVSLGPNLERLLFTYGLIPKRYFLVSHLNRYMPFFTA
ncbi:MAG: rhomboid family intramembrane serine protease, partial [Deltaproteobacteria bacterium]|nr:rhomboid family intramembrane serine protease [Deltaproteobacteria bacterium]